MPRSRHQSPNLLAAWRGYGNNSMRKHIALFACLLLMMPLCAGQIRRTTTRRASIQPRITPGGNVTCQASVTSALTCTSPALTVAAGDMIVLWLYSQLSYRITDSCNQVWTSYTNLTPQLWVATNAKAGACTITSTRTSGTDATQIFIAADYSGVASIGAMVKFTSNQPGGGAGTTQPCTRTITTQDPGNYVIGGINLNQGSGTNTTMTASSGTPIGLAQNSSVSLLMVTNTSATTGTALTVGATWTTTATGYCQSSAVELRASTNITGGRLAVLSDQTKDVLIHTPGNASYTLPNFGLSPAWCAWVMPTGSASNTYRLSVQAPATLNGQANPITIPAWQMSRVCQHGAGTGAVSARSPRTLRTTRAIAASGQSNCNAATAVTTCSGAPMTVAAGDTVVLVMYTIVAGYTVSDNCGGSWSLKFTGTSRLQVWAGTGGSGS